MGRVGISLAKLPQALGIRVKALGFRESGSGVILSLEFRDFETKQIEEFKVMAGVYGLEGLGIRV